MKHLIDDAVPWIIALLVSLIFFRILFGSWRDLLDCFRSWIATILRRIPFGHRVQSQMELRASAEHLKLALPMAVGLISELICRALLVGLAQ